MRWERVARWGAAAGGLAIAASLVLSTRSRPPERQLAPMAATADPAATSQTGRGVSTRYNATLNQEKWRLEYGSSKALLGGRSEWTQVHLVFNGNGTEVWADTVTSRGAVTGTQAPSALDLKGHVRLRTAEGATVSGESATYDDGSGLTQMPGPVTFERGTMSGSGTGAVYDRAAGVFRLLADATTVTRPETPDALPVQAQAASMTFTAGTRTLLYDGQARITQGPDMMSATRATLYLDDAEQQFRLIELRGRARVTPAPGQRSRTPDMQAQDIDLTFRPGTQRLERGRLQRQATLVATDATGRRGISGGQIAFSTAPDGQTLTRLDASDRVVVTTPAARDTPERQISAPLLAARGSDTAGLTSAVFSGGATFIEVPRASGRTTQRRGTGQTLTLKLQGQLDAIDEAQFQRDVTFADGDMAGDADVGTYFASRGRLTLQPDAKAPRRWPHATNGTIRVDARELIDIDLDSRSLHARGDVKTVNPGARDTKPATGLFTGSEPTYGFGAEFWYDSSRKQARYAGPGALLRQGDNQVSGQEVTVMDDSRDLVASLAVRSEMLLVDGATSAGTTTPAKPAGTRYTITADRMEYTDATRTATYTGTPATLLTPDAETTARTIVLTLAAESRTLKTLDARTDVHATMPEGRQAVADTLLYDRASDRYTLTGKAGRPVVLRTRDKAGKCSESRGRLGFFTTGQGAPTFPLGDSNPGGVTTTDVPCTGEVK